MTSTNLDATYDVKLSNSIILLASFSIFSMAFVALMTMFGFESLNKFSPIITGLVFIIAFFMSIKALIYRSMLLVLGTFTFAFLFLSLTLLFFPQNGPAVFSKDIAQLLIYGIYPCLMIVSIKDISVFQKTLINWTPFLFCLTTIIFSTLFSNDEVTYSMWLSYQMAFVSLLILSDLFTSFSFYKISAFMFLLIIIFNVGSRGPILVIAIYTVWKIFSKIISKNFIVNFKNDYIFRRTMLFFSSCITIFLMFWKQILKVFSVILLKLGVNSRNVLLFSEGRFFHDSGRSILYSQVFNELNRSPFWGLGFLGDRIVLSPDAASNGGYVHNMFLEILSHFGYFFGLIIIVIFLAISIIALSSKNTSIRELAPIFFCMGVVQQLFSNSYVINIHFWIFLGIALKASKELMLNIKPNSFVPIITEKEI